MPWNHAHGPAALELFASEADEADTDDDGPAEWIVDEGEETPDADAGAPEADEPLLLPLLFPVADSAAVTNAAIGGPGNTYLKPPL